MGQTLIVGLDITLMPPAHTGKLSRAGRDSSHHHKRYERYRHEGEPAVDASLTGTNACPTALKINARKLSLYLADEQEQVPELQAGKLSHGRNLPALWFAADRPCRFQRRCW